MMTVVISSHRPLCSIFVAHLRSVIQCFKAAVSQSLIWTALYLTVEELSHLELQGFSRWRTGNSVETSSLTQCPPFLLK